MPNLRRYGGVANRDAGRNALADGGRRLSECAIPGPGGGNPPYLRPVWSALPGLYPGTRPAWERDSEGIRPDLTGGSEMTEKPITVALADGHIGVATQTPDAWWELGVWDADGGLVEALDTAGSATEARMKIYAYERRRLLPAMTMREA